ncbi:MAG: nucleotide-binding protein [Thermodesulfobacteriota bacterium]|nr:nucleotide-binding protein [Thermodesulfobacteriota bacterium]
MRLFVASSSEAKEVAYAAQARLEDYAEVTVWDEGIFQLSEYALESLLNELGKSDFGIFIFTPDDVTKVRDEEHRAVRDNVVFELGLFIGRLGRERSFIIMPRETKDFHLPTDLIGITTGRFNPNRANGNLEAALGPACNKIQQLIKKLGPLPAKGMSSSLGDRVLFYDNFEHFLGWKPFEKGQVTQSRNFSFTTGIKTGNFSLKKYRANDPSGGYKKMTRSAGLGLVFSGAIYRPSTLPAGLGDRLAIENSEFNGYGFGLLHGNNIAWIERRDRGRHRRISPNHAIEIPEDKWYQFEFHIKTDGVFDLRIYDDSGNELLGFSSNPDNSYSSFDRVVVHGGGFRPYYVDNLKVEIV